jgi:hypothetical protein
MKDIRYINLNGVRQTYIIMYEQDGIRYIFNRSVKWCDYISFKKLQKIIDLLGENAILKFMDRLRNMYINIDDLTNTFILDTTKFSILEIHSEWENKKRCDQKVIEERKTELCEEYNAVKRSDQLDDIDIENLDLNISKYIKNQLKKWLIEIYKEIADYAKLIQDDIVETSLGMTIERLKNQKTSLESDIKKKIDRINDLDKEIKDNSIKLARQNYIIEKFYKQYIFTPKEKDFIDRKINEYEL